MRLLFVNEELEYTGTTSYSLDLASGLKKAGHEVRMCSTGGPQEEAFRRRRVETYRIRTDLLSYWKLLEYLREYAPDLVHIQNRRSLALGRRVSKKLRAPHVVTVHRVPEGEPARLEHPLLAGVIAANELIREHLVNVQGLPKSLIRVIPRGVDSEELAPEPGRAFPAPGSGLLPALGSVGRLSSVKGHEVFLRASRIVLDRGLEAVFTVVGEGEDEARLWKLVRELKLERSVTFSPHVPDRRQLYRALDVLVVPSLRGGLGYSVLEAMAMGKAVVASAVGEILHIVQDGKTGLLVPEGDAEALAAGMERLVRDPELAEALGRAARERVVEGFDLKTMLGATAGFYEEVLARLGISPSAREGA
ncbi:MAG: glycosyltransferase family 4 protein [Planctomycetota bacterium]